MKCYTCDKEIDTDVVFDNKELIWYGYYCNTKLVRVICRECIVDESKKKVYIDGK